MTLLKSFYLSGALLVLHIAAELYFYQQFLWFDILMHFLGGFVATCAAIGFLRNRQVAFRAEPSRIFTPYVFYVITVLGIVAMVSIGWEWFEHIRDLINQSIALRSNEDLVIHQPSVGDTMADFFMDFVGAVVALILFRRTYGKSKA